MKHRCLTERKALRIPLLNSYIKTIKDISLKTIKENNRKILNSIENIHTPKKNIYLGIPDNDSLFISKKYTGRKQFSSTSYKSQQDLFMARTKSGIINKENLSENVPYSKTQPGIYNSDFFENVIAKRKLRIQVIKEITKKNSRIPFKERMEFENSSENKLTNIIQKIKIINESKPIPTIKLKKKYRQTHYGKWYLKPNDYRKTVIY